MSNLNLTPIISGFNLFKIRENFEKIKDLFDNKVLFRQTEEPNAMEMPLDMNGQPILNVSTLDVANLTVNGVPLPSYLQQFLADFDPQESTVAVQKKTFGSTSGYTVTLDTPYDAPKDKIIVFKNGVKQAVSDYEFDGQILEFTSELVFGDVIEVVYFTACLGIEDLNIQIENVEHLETALGLRQVLLIPGSNIKTINGESILDSGDLELATPGQLYTTPSENISVDGVMTPGTTAFFYATVTDDIEFTIDTGMFPNTGGAIYLKVVDGDDHTVTWGSNINWGTAGEPTLDSVDVLQFISFDGGTSWYGTQIVTGAV